MAKKIEFYTISLNNELGVTDYSVREFFESIEQQMLGENRTGTLVREIDDKLIRIFPFYYTTTRRQFVIPFGKLKNKNVPYWENEDHQLEEVPIDLYDVNSLGYDSDYRVMVFTTNREGPSVQNVEKYLNTFIPRACGLSVKIEPIKYNSGIEKVRNAELVRSVTLNLNLWQPLNNFYANEIIENRDRGLISAIKRIADTARDSGDGKTLSLTLGLGKGAKKDDTLNMESMLYLLDNLNIEAEFVKEIVVNYKNGRDEKVDIARLKQSQMVLFYNCRNNGQVTPQRVLDNINDAVTEKILVITNKIAEHFRNHIQYVGDRIDIVTAWTNEQD